MIRLIRGRYEPSDAATIACQSSHCVARKTPIIGGLAGISAPIIIGPLLRGGDFTLPLTFMACIALLGACSYIFVVGKLERVNG
jgi:hypothetical protein